MKKKWLSFLLCGVLFVGITGCKNGTSVTDSSGEDETGEQTVVTTIAEVIFPFTNGYAAVLGADGISYVIDENGKATSQLGDKDEFVNGYIITSGRVTDAKGNTVYEKVENQSYLSVSKCGNAIVRITKESLAGTDWETSIISQNGETITTLDSSSYELIGGDVYQKGRVLVNAKTGKTYTFRTDVESKGKDVDGYFYFMSPADNTRYVVREDLEIVYDLSSDYHSNFKFLGIINEQYFYGMDEKEDSKTYGIYDMSGKVVKDLTEGGIKSVFLYDDVFYVESNTGYVYTLDSNFNYIVEPTKDFNGIFFPTTKGILGFIGGKVYLLDENLGLHHELTYIKDFYYRDIDFDIMQESVNAGYTWYLQDKFLYGDDGQIYNLETERLLQIYG